MSGWCWRGGVGRRLVLRLAGLLMLAGVALAGLAALEPTRAQQPNPQASHDFVQVRLTEKNIVGFIAAQKDIGAIAPKLEAAGDNVSETLQKELDDFARKHSFKDFADFEAVVDSIMMVMEGIDPGTGEYTDPIELTKQDIEALKADPAVPADERKRQLEYMTEKLKELQPLKFKENIDIVKKYAKQIDEVLR